MGFDASADRAAATPVGWKAIEDFKPGDLILARSEHDRNGPIEAKRVLNTFTRVGEVVQVCVRGKSIGTTAEHPFYVDARGWTPAGMFDEGDRLCSHDDTTNPVERVGTIHLVTTVYNLEVEEYHTYFVGGPDWGFSVWAHNAEYELHPLGDGTYALRNKATGEWVKADSASPNLNGTTKVFSEAEIQQWKAGNPGETLVRPNPLPTPRAGSTRGGPGRFENANESMPASSASHQQHSTGSPQGTVYQVGRVKFDGFHDGVLLESKGTGYSQLLSSNKLVGGTEALGNVVTEKLIAQAQRQVRAARRTRTPIEWRVAEKDVADFLRDEFKQKKIRIRVTYSPLG